MKNFFSLLLLLSTLQLSAGPDFKKLDSLLRHLEKNNKAMLSAAITEKGQMLFQQATGFADVTQNKKANVYTLYRIGSISKMYTAVMILQLVDEKKLRLDSKLSEFYPSLPQAKKISIEHLLAHRSGLPNFTSAEDYLSWNVKAHTEAELVQKFQGGKSEFEPGSAFSYSNTNYVLLSYILEKITRSSYADQLRQRICAKLSLSDTRAGTAIATANNEAQSYQFEKGQWTQQPETHPSVPMGAGNIVSTPKDLCLFIEGLFEGKLISTDLLNKMTDLKDGYGLGMISMPYGDRVFFGHTGGIDGFQSILAYNKGSKAAICITGNGFNYSMNDVAIAMLASYYGDPFSIPSFEKKTLSAADSKSPEGTYSNSKINMQISIRRENGQLMAQATGQSAFPLEQKSELEYGFATAGVVILFQQDQDGGIRSLRLKQGGMDLLFDKE